MVDQLRDFIRAWVPSVALVGSKPRVRSKKLVALDLASYTKVERHIVSQQEIEPSFLPACLPYGDIFII